MSKSWMALRSIITVATFAITAVGCDRTTSDTSAEGTMGPSRTPTATATASPEPTTADLGWTLWGGQIEGRGGAASISIRPDPEQHTSLWLVDFPHTRLRCDVSEEPMHWIVERCVGLYPDLTLDIPRSPDGLMRIEVYWEYRGEVVGYSANFRRVAASADPVASGIELAWRLPSRGLAYGTVAAVDNIILAGGGSRFVELLDPDTGELFSYIDVSGDGLAPEPRASVAKIEGHDEFAYIATHHHGLLIYDISDPRLPLLLGQSFASAIEDDNTPMTSIADIAVSTDGLMLYLASVSEGVVQIQIVDTTDRKNPEYIAAVSLPAADQTMSDNGSTIALTLDRHNGRETLYVNQEGVGLLILDVEEPNRIEELGRWSEPGFLGTGGAAFVVQGRLYYAHPDARYDGALELFDVTDPASVTLIGTYRSRPGLVLGDVSVADGVAYVAYHLDGLRVVDLSDPTDPREIAHYDPSPTHREKYLHQGVSSVTVAERHVFVTDRDSGLYALDRPDGADRD